MIYLYVGKNTIKLLSLSKTLLSQYNISYFYKYHENDLLAEGRVKNVDILASAVKEALTQAQPNSVSETSVCLILPQESFEFARYDIPVDISQAAIPPFIRDKARADLNLDLDTAFFDYLQIKQDGASKVHFFAQAESMSAGFDEVFKLLGLVIENIVPETLCYFTLFQKTLRAEKKETIFYVYHDEKKSFGYLYDSFGLLRKDKYSFKEPFETSLKDTVETLGKDNITFNRIILAGSGSEKFRQDLFTKKIGVWTNPLKKIVLNFYQEYLKLIIVDPNEKFPLLDLDVCLGGFIFTRENTSFALKRGSGGKSRTLPSFSSRLPVKLRDIVIFLASFALSFLLIFFLPRFFDNFQSIKLPSLPFVPASASPTPVPTEKPSPTPIPNIDKKSIKIKVLNGSGTLGLASDVKDILLEKEYSDILTGNADSFDLEETKIQVKDEHKAAANVLIEDLKDNVAISQKDVTLLEKDDSADIILIIGKDFK